MKLIFLNRWNTYSYLVRKKIEKKGQGKRPKMKIWTSERSNHVHTQRTSLEYRATLHRATKIALASLL
jgi:hypothetical protein